MATSTAQAIATIPVYDYYMAPGDPTSPTPKGESGRRVKVSLDYSLASSQNPITGLDGAPITTTTDGNGFWQVNLVATDKINPSGVLYLVEIEGGRSYLINPITTGAPAIGWQSSAIIVNAPSGIGVAGFSLPGPVTLTGNLTVTGALYAGKLIPAGEPVFDVTHPSFAGGAKGDVRAVTDAAIGAGSLVLTSLTANFTSADVGKVISITGADAVPNPANTPTGAALAGATNLGAGNYQAVATFVNSNFQETIASPVSVAVALTAGQQFQVTITGVPIGIVQINFYLTAAAGGVNLGKFATIIAAGTTAVATLTAAGQGNPAATAPLTNNTGCALISTIVSVVNATTATIAHFAVSTVIGQTAQFGTDDTVAFAAAETACDFAGGGVCYVPGPGIALTGRYFINGGQSIAISGGTLPKNIIWRGAGFSSQLVLMLSRGNGVAPGMIFTVDAGGALMTPNTTQVATNVTIEDLYFDGNSRNLSGLYGEDLTSPTQGAPVHCAINTWRVQTLNIWRNYFTDFAREAVWLGTARNTTGLIDKNDVKIHQNTYFATAYGSTVESAKGVQFLGNIVNGLKNSTTNENVYFVSYNYRDLIDIHVLNTIADGGGAYGMFVQSNMQTANILIEGAIVAGNDIRNFAGTAAIYGIPNALITDNDVLRNNVLYALAVAHGETVTNNRVEWNQQMGIVVDAFANVNQPVAKDWLVADNTVRNNNQGGFNDQRRCGIVLGISGTTPKVDGGQLLTNHVFDDQVVQTQWAIGTPTLPGIVINTRIEGNDFRNNAGVDGFQFASNIVNTKVGNIVRNNAGWNPRGAITAPAVPASGVGVTNDSGYDVTAYVYAGVVTQLQLGLAPPVTGALTTASTGGTLAGATTYYYRVTALNSLGESLASVEVSIAVPAGTNTNTVTIPWARVPAATGYNVYGRTTGAETKITAANNTQGLKYTDTGSALSGALPATNTTGTNTGMTSGPIRVPAYSALIPVYQTGSPPSWNWMAE